jgi:hypothetical protein
MSLITLVAVGIIGGGCAGVLVWLAWPWMKRHPGRSVTLAILGASLVAGWLTLVQTSRGRRMTVINESGESYTITMRQGGGVPIPLGTLRPGTTRRYRVRPERGSVVLTWTPAGSDQPVCTVGFSLGEPMMLPLGATIRLNANGSFSNRVGPAILGY